MNTKRKTRKKISVLVTGGAGFIGSHLVDELLKDSYEVVVLDDLSGGYEKNIHPKAIFIRGSITDKALVHKIFAKYQFIYVFHLAAYAAEGLSHFIRKFNYENNLIGSINIINAATHHGVKCLVFTSSIAVYGAGQVPMKETTMPIPEDPYGIAKYAVELDLRSAHDMFGLDYIIFRPHNVYGERQNIADKYRNVIGIFMNQILQDEPMSIFGDGMQQRAFTHIADVAPIIARSVINEKAYNKVFNVGADKPYTVKHLSKVVSKAMGAKHAIRHFPTRKEAKIAYADHSNAKKILGYRDKVSLEEGIKKMSGWVKKEGARNSKPFKKIEIRKNLPEAWR